LAWLGFFGCLLIIGMAAETATDAWLPAVISHTAAGLGCTASALGLVFVLRRHADRQPWSSIGRTLDRAVIPHLLSASCSRPSSPRSPPARGRWSIPVVDEMSPRRLVVDAKADERVFKARVRTAQDAAAAADCRV
jgi:hypothetical protein